MVKKLSVFIYICGLFILFCSCTTEVSEFLPGQQVGDEDFVWVCKKPFAYFALTEDHGQDHYGHMKGYFEKKEEKFCFYSYFDIYGGITDFTGPEFWGDSSANDDFWGYAKYYETYFEFEIECDRINFFNGELPTLRFEKMTKEEFLKVYPDIQKASDIVE